MRRRFAFAPAAIWALVILALGSIPSLTPPVDLPIDKVGHFGMFFVLGALLAFGLQRAQRRPPLFLALAAGIAVGVVDELHQRAVPGRSAELADLLADSAGVIAGVWLTHRVLARRWSIQRAAQRPHADSEAGSRTPDAGITQEHRA